MTTDSLQYFAQKAFNQKTKATFNSLVLGFLRASLKISYQSNAKIKWRMAYFFNDY